MKTVIKNGRKGFGSARLGSIAALLLCLATGFAYAAETVETQQPAVLPWISEVVKMNDAGVPQDVMANYVKNTSARSTLSADDIIYLHNHNIPTPLVTAMIEHGAMGGQTTAPAAGVAMPTTPAPAPVYGYPSTATYAQTPPDYGSDQTQPQINYNYYGSSDYGNGYPYYNYPYYPYYYSYPVVFFSSRSCFRNGVFCRPGFNNGFHVHSNGAVHFNGGFHGTGGFHTTTGFSHGSAMGGMHR